MTPSTLLYLSVLGQSVLPGSTLTIEQAKEEARLVVVAEVVEIQMVVGVGAAAVGTGTRLKLSETLKGRTTPEELHRLSLTFSACGPERSPKVGEEFVVFLAGFHGRLVISKLLAKSGANIGAVRAAGPYVPARPRPGSPDGPKRSRPGRPVASPTAVVLPLRRIVKSASVPGRGAIDERRQE